MGLNISRKFGEAFVIRTAEGDTWVRLVKFQKGAVLVAIEGPGHVIRGELIPELEEKKPA